MKASQRIGLVIAMAAVAGMAQKPAETKSPIQAVAFLFGEWTPKGNTELGAATGTASFTPDLNAQIVMRKNAVKYTSPNAATIVHDDVLIIYAEGANNGLRAIYFDTEGHVIHYGITIPEPGTAVFESDAATPGPRYRLTHQVKGQEMMTKFEIRAPGQAEYKTYVSGLTVKK